MRIDNEDNYKTVIALSPTEARLRKECADRKKMIETNQRIWEERKARMIEVDGRKYEPGIGLDITLRSKIARENKQALEKAKRDQSEKRRLRIIASKLGDMEVKTWFSLAKAALGTEDLGIILQPEYIVASGHHLFDEKNTKPQHMFQLISIQAPAGLIEILENKSSPTQGKNIVVNQAQAKLRNNLKSEERKLLDRIIMERFTIEKDRLTPYFEDITTLYWCAMCRAVYTFALPTWINTGSDKTYRNRNTYDLQFGEISSHSDYPEDPILHYQSLVIKSILAHRIQQAILRGEITVSHEKPSTCALM